MTVPPTVDDTAVRDKQMSDFGRERIASEKRRREHLPSHERAFCIGLFAVTAMLVCYAAEARSPTIASVAVAEPDVVLRDLRTPCMDGFNSPWLLDDAPE